MAATHTLFGKPLESLESRLLLSQDLMFDFVAATANASGSNGVLIAGVDSLSIDATVRNRGNQDSFHSDLKVIFTRDLEIPDSDREDLSIGKLRVPDLYTNESISISRTFDLPSLESGEYYVFLRLKPEEGFGIFSSWRDPKINNTMYTGLKVVVDGTAPPEDPGLITGGIRASLRGPGSVSVIRRDDGKFNVEAVGTTSTSRLTIEPAPGYNHLGDVRVRGSLSSLEMKVALPGNLTIEGDVREVNLRHVLGSTISLLGTGREATVRAWAMDGVNLTAAAPLKLLQTGAWLALGDTQGLITAPAIKEMKIQGSLAADVRLTGFAGRVTLEKVTLDDWLLSESFSVRGNLKQFRAQGLYDGAGLTVSGDLRTCDIRGDMEGIVSATTIGKFSVQGDMTDSTLLAGAFLGNDAQLGGGDDVFGVGRIDDFSCMDDVLRSTISAGLNPMNSIVGDSDDRFVTTPGSRIGKIAVKDRLFDSTFYAPIIPSKVRIGGWTISTAGDSRFVTRLP
jgi:hypothetical protein